MIDAADQELAEMVRATRAAVPRAPTVVVVGETKRGKSSLVNVLLRHPGLSPVDVDVATSAWIEFRHGNALTASFANYHTGQLESVPPEALWDLATVCGNAQTGTLPPRAVQVTCTAPLLASGMRLVDTPGVGGLNVSHREITLEAMGEASVVLLVLDPNAPLSTPELDFLRAAAERVELVVFALTKTDAHFSWRDIEADDRLLVAREMPRLADAPWFPVSARLAEKAMQLGSGSIAEELIVESGVPALASALHMATTGRADLLDAANWLRTARSALGRHDADLKSRAALADPAPEEVANAERRRMEARRVAQRTEREMRADLNSRTRRLKEGVNTRLTAATVALTDGWQRRLDTTRLERSDVLAAALNADMEALAVQQSRAATEDVQTLARTAFAEFLPDDVAADAIDRLAVQARIAEISAADPAYRNRMEKRVLLATGATSGLFVGRTVATVLGHGILFGPLGPVSLAIGAAVSLLMNRMRTGQLDRAAQRSWISSSVLEVRERLRGELLSALGEAETELASLLEDATALLVKDADSRMEALDRVLTQERTQRLQAKMTIEEGRRTVNAT